MSSGYNPSPEELARVQAALAANPPQGTSITVGDHPDIVSYGHGPTVGHGVAAGLSSYAASPDDQPPPVVQAPQVSLAPPPALVQTQQPPTPQGFSSLYPGLGFPRSQNGWRTA